MAGIRSSGPLGGAFLAVVVVSLLGTLLITKVEAQKTAKAKATVAANATTMVEGEGAGKGEGAGEGEGAGAGCPANNCHLKMTAGLSSLAKKNISEVATEVCKNDSLLRGVVLECGGDLTGCSVKGMDGLRSVLIKIFIKLQTASCKTTDPTSYLCALGSYEKIFEKCTEPIASILLAATPPPTPSTTAATTTVASLPTTSAMPEVTTMAGNASLGSSSTGANGTNSTDPVPTPPSTYRRRRAAPNSERLRRSDNDTNASANTTAEGGAPTETDSGKTGGAGDSGLAAGSDAAKPAADGNATVADAGGSTGQATGEGTATPKPATGPLAVNCDDHAKVVTCMLENTQKDCAMQAVTDIQGMLIESFKPFLDSYNCFEKFQQTANGTLEALKAKYSKAETATKKSAAVRLSSTAALSATAAAAAASVLLLIY